MVCCMVVVLLFLFVFRWFAFLMKVFWYICIMVWKSICNLVRRDNYVSSSIQWWNYSWFVVSIYFPEFLPNLFGWSSGVNLQTQSMCLSWKLCLMALLHWNVLNLVVCWVLSVFSIFCSHYDLSLSYSSFHHATVGLHFVSEDALGMVFAFSIVFWFCTFIVIVLSFWNCV